MREIEFLPPWYPKMRRRRRLVALQAWMTLVLLSGLGLWVALSHHNLHSARRELAGLGNDISRTDVELQKLDDLIRLQKQWRVQDEIIAKLGTHVESTRMIKAIENAMPANMALLDLSIETEDKPAAAPSLAGTAGLQSGKTAAVSQRRLKVKLLGVSPTDVELANFLHQLSETPYFEQVAMTYARERTDGNHIMREFEVTFSVNLTTASGA